jgi:transcriptional regulator with XRE-family HTH domain
VSESTIGSALVARREKLGLSRVEAAGKIGMSRTTYSSHERDSQRPSADVFPDLAEFLTVSIEEFLALYGATSIAAVRPSLERVLLARDSATVQPLEPSKSIFAQELSGEPAPPVPVAFVAKTPKSPKTEERVKPAKGKKKKKKKGKSAKD